MHMALRRYRIRAGSLEAAERRVREELVPLLREIAGFHAYYLVSEGDGSITSIALFTTAAGAVGGDRLCADWFRADWPTFRAVGPEAAVGEALVHETAPQVRSLTLADASHWPERRTAPDRRRRQDRRQAGDRRAASVHVPFSASS